VKTIPKQAIIDFIDDKSREFGSMMDLKTCQRILDFIELYEIEKETK